MPDKQFEYNHKFTQTHTISVELECFFHILVLASMRITFLKFGGFSFLNIAGSKVYLNTKN